MSVTLVFYHITFRIPAEKPRAYLFPTTNKPSFANYISALTWTPTLETSRGTIDYTSGPNGLPRSGD
jgi:hypothetical protein